MEVLIGILKEVVPFIKDWGALIIAGISLLVAIISLFKSSKAQRLQNKVNELELKIKQNELDKIAKEKEDSVLACVKSLLGNILSEEQAAQFTVENVTNALSHGLTESFLNAALSLRDEVKKDTWSVCFSENGFNEVLWLKYADQHRGFVQIYDLENNDNFLCGKQEKCANCGIKNYGTPLYPIYYSDTPYDATKFAKFVMLRKIAETTATQIPPELYAGMGSALWEQERTTLIKKECHKYDEEWRMITGCIMKPPVMMEWIPSGIILGLRMDVAEENLVVSMAKEAGIKNIYKSYINAQNKLDAYPLKL